MAFPAPGDRMIRGRKALKSNTESFHPNVKLFARPRVSLDEEDQALMLEVARNDTQAFRRLYDRYKAPILSYLTAFVGSRAVAEDLLQETFLRVYRHRREYTQEHRFSTWLWTIARRLAIDHSRRSATKFELGGLDESQVGADPDAIPDAEAALLQRARREAVLHCLGELAPAAREAVALRTFSELTYDELAVAIGASIAAVKSILHRAKQRLLDCLRAGGHHG